MQPARKKRRRTESIPWEMIASFLSFDDVKSLRLTSHTVAMRLHESMDPNCCINWLSHVLKERNVYFMNQVDRWKDTATMSDEGILAAAVTGSSSSLSFDNLFRVLRVLQVLPVEIEIAYSGKYGRHCFGTDYSSMESTSCRKVYPDCQRMDCPTCKVKIPRVDDPPKDRQDSSLSKPTELNDDICIKVKGSKRLVLDQYFNKCIPNLPANLACPCCRSQDRTLMLTEFSYRSARGTERRDASDMSLTFTPCVEQEEEVTNNNNDEDEEEGGVLRADASPVSKDRIERDYERFPPKYHECFYLSEDLVQRPPDCKHAIAIHCNACREFGVFRPANLYPVWRRDDDGSKSWTAAMGLNGEQQLDEDESHEEDYDE